MYSGRIWLGSVALSGVLLLSSMPGLGSVPTAAAQTGVALSSTPTLIGTQAPIVSQQLGFTAKNVAASDYVKEAVKIAATKAPSTVQAATSTQKASETTKKAPETKKALPQRPVQVAKAEPAKQVSRGGASASGIVSTALSLQGIPYVFGGTTRKGFDCSGFTQYVYKASGISIPRTSYTQFNSGTPVSKQDLQPGDLVFFTTYSKGASHVGIYVGNGTFVHASDSGVRTTSLNDSYYKSRYLGARRM
ncbi:C40 family peptidase [Paradesulfitobacterium ferrireducens]|uniref:C40 family peptidase n=1 Tax=Paradesulfitobacterium ferrireducens TaxID=2816476 RepID=UPI002E28CD49|nr:NlpC/P60 family protein [Paradesulfitobacterium ferrireducens]